jgi:hypothetical protein
VMDSPAQGRTRYRSQGRLSSWFVRLCVKSGRFVTSGPIVGCRLVARAFPAAGIRGTD